VAKGVHGLSSIKLKKIFWLFNLFVCLLLGSLLIIAIGLDRDLKGIRSGHRIGNRESNVKSLEERGFPFSFLVIGDTQGSKRGERLIKSALRNGQYSFMIHLGDLVKKPDRWDHLYFLTEMATEVNPPFPVFVVPGNHDIDYASVRIKDGERRMTRESFDSSYGARSFHFAFNQCLFILTEIDPQNPNEYLNYLKKVLSTQGEGRKHIFVCIHYPPKLFEYIDDVFPREEEFYSLLESYKVTSCFFGHYHGYWRGQRNGVNYIITGGGGRLKETQSEWGKFHHILKVTVRPHEVTEEMIAHEKGFSIEDLFEERVFVHLLPIIQGRVWILYGVGLFVMIWGIGSFILIIKSFRKARH
jgi:Icc-related predicted phosphoesterase